MDYKNWMLSKLSCYAAGEIDDHILNRNMGFEATDELSSRMKRFSREKLTQIDPREGLIYYGIFKKDENMAVKGLQSKILEIAKELSSVKTLPREKLESLRKLCLDISDQAEVYEEDYHPQFLAA